MHSLFCSLFLCLVSSFSWAADFNSLRTPNISANTLFLYQNSNFHQENPDPANVDSQPNGFNIQEAELQFYADVDPYTSLSVLLSIHPTLEGNAAGTGVEEKWQLEPEEVYAQSLALPATTLRIGKFKAALGKHNTLHSHVFPFVKAPLANTAFLGDEGLNDLGVSAAVLLPGSWYDELTLQFFRGQGENEEFNSPSPSDGVGLVHWKNLFDLSDDLTAEIGLSYGQGANSLAGTTSLTGGDLTFKWRPAVGGRSQALIWGTESLSRLQTQRGVVDEKGRGLMTFVQYQFAERWSALYRYDTKEVRDSFDPVALPNELCERHSLGLVYAPSEFSSFRLEYDRAHGGLLNSQGDVTDQTVFLQANFTVGAHPSHTY